MPDSAVKVLLRAELLPTGEYVLGKSCDWLSWRGSGGFYPHYLPAIVGSEGRQVAAFFLGYGWFALLSKMGPKP